MNRLSFIKSLGIGAGGLVLPANPFVVNQTIKIYDNYLRGTTHYQYNKIKKQIKEGDNLLLKREPENFYDSFAIEVYFENYKLGYIAAYENVPLANMMDQGVELQAQVSIHQKDKNYSNLGVEIYTQLVVASEQLINLLSTDNRADDAIDLYRNNR